VRNNSSKGNPQNDPRPPVPDWPPPHGLDFSSKRKTKTKTTQGHFDARLAAAIEAVDSGNEARREERLADSLREFDAARTRAREVILIAPAASKTGRVGSGANLIMGVVMDRTIRVRTAAWFATAVVLSVFATLLVMQEWRVDAAPGDSDATGDTHGALSSVRLSGW